MLIFDASVLADGRGNRVRIGERPEEIAIFRADVHSPISRVDSTRPTAGSPAHSGLASNQSIVELSA